MYSAGLLSSVLTLNRWEPAYTGWPDEYGTFFLILFFSGFMLKLHFMMAAQNLQLTEHLQDMVEERTKEVTLLLSERQKILSEFLHDLKSPIACISAYLQLVKENDIHVDEKTQEKIDMIEKNYEELSVQIRSIQDFNAGISPVSRPGKNSTFGSWRRPITPETGRMWRSSAPCFFFLSRLSPARCRGILNPSPEPSKIWYSTLWISQRPREKSCCPFPWKMEIICYPSAIPDAALTRIFFPIFLKSHSFSTRKEEGGNGLGLFLVKTIAQEHQGNVSAESVPGEGCRITLTLPAPE